MPIYEYECKECRHRFDVLQKRNDPAIQECERCRGEVRKLISAPPVILKGAGFYETEYGRARHNHPDHKDKDKDKDKATKDTANSSSSESKSSKDTPSSSSKPAASSSSDSSKPKSPGSGKKTAQAA